MAADGSLHKVEISRWCNRDTGWLRSKNHRNGITRLRTGKQISSAVHGSLDSSCAAVVKRLHAHRIIQHESHGNRSFALTDKRPARAGHAGRRT